MSESDIVQPKPVFRKFCLDVLSATLLSPSVVLLSLKYIQQLMINLKESNKIVNTGEGAEYRFFTGALILANKFLDDNTFTNKTWADITGMKIKDVNHLEMQFLNGIDFRLFTSSDHYSEWLANLTQFTSNYMPSQHQVAFQQQVAAAQSPISPMDYTSTPVEPNFGLMRQHGSALVGSQGSQTTAPVALSMASISHYIDSVKQIHQKTASTMRYQRVPASTMYSQQSQALVTLAAHPSQSQYMNLPASSKVQQASATGVYQGPTANCNSSPIPMSYTYQSGAPESVQRKRSANAAFEDAMDRSPCYESDSLSRTSQVPAMVPTHKRFSSASSVSALMGIGAGQDMVHGGPSPLIQQQRNHPQSTFSHRASVGSLPTSFRSQHQRSASGSYCVDMAGYSSSYGQEPTHLPMAMPNTFSRSGVVHPLDKEQDYYRPSSRMDVSYSGSHPMHVRTTSSAGCTQGYRPVTPPQCSPNKCEPSCQSMRCAPNSNNGSAYEVDPRLWGPLDSLSLYAITTQAAKRVVAQSKALSASANGLHMYYPTTLA
ncbi:hypothetical protein BGZ54_000842 [Gamsiella multidivaricata]|nr:hypothetical protein BGZ54_000842 [Gamsiella multidivaricata]